MNNQHQPKQLIEEKMPSCGELIKEVTNKKSSEIMMGTYRQSLPFAEGLSSEQLYGLLHFLFTDDSVVKLNVHISDEMAFQSPVVKLCISFMGIIQRETSIKLTKTGALPMKIVNELYELQHIIEMIWNTPIMVRTENDSISIQLIKIISGIAGLTKIRQGKLSLTAKGIGLIESPANLLLLLTTNYFLKFSWSYFDRYESQNAAQFGAGYTLLLLSKYGHQEREATFYSKKFLEAFPASIDEFEPGFIISPEDNFNNCFIWRTFQRGLYWLGLIETRETGKFIDGTRIEWVKTTPLFDELVKVDQY